jgi:hypothetical protein
MLFLRRNAKNIDILALQNIQQQQMKVTKEKIFKLKELLEEMKIK